MRLQTKYIMCLLWGVGDGDGDDYAAHEAEDDNGNAGDNNESEKS